MSKPPRQSKSRSPVLHNLEPRTLLSTTMLRQFNVDLGGGGSLVATSDAIYLRDWSTDGSVAGQRTVANAPSVSGGFPFSGGVAGSASQRAAFIGGRETGPARVDVPNALFDPFSNVLPITVGKWSYFAGRNSLLRASDSLSIPSLVQQLTTDERVMSLARVGSTSGVAFVVNDRLWVTDGTRTTLLAGDVSYPLASAGAFVYFAKSDAKKGSELWRTDGSAAGTQRVADLRHGAAGSSPKVWGAVGNVALFTADDGSAVALWCSDGTEAGTRRISSAAPNFDATGTIGLMNAGSKAYYAVFTSDHSHWTPWVTDGTQAGTHAIGNWGSTGLIFDGTHGLLQTTMSGRLYFVAQPQAGVMELWRTDGTSGGTTRAADISSALSASSFPGRLTAFNGAIYLNVSFGSINRTWRFSDSAISINGEAFDDVDADMTHDAGEKARKGVRIYIDANNNRSFDAGEQSTLTDSRGRYAFSGLAAGSYHLRQVAPVGTQDTAPDYNLQLVAGDHVVKTFGSTVPTMRISGSVSSAEGGIGGFIVYLDLNGNGKREKREPATVTDVTGNYSIRPAAAGVYTARLISQSAFMATGAESRKVRAKTNRTTIANFTQARPGFLDVTAYNDTDADGVRDANEKLIKGLTLTDALGKQLSPNASGHYHVAVAPGTLNTPSVTASGWRQTTKGFVYVPELPTISAEQTLPVEITLTKLAKISASAFYDTNKNGKQDQAESWVDYVNDFAIDLNHDGNFDDTESLGFLGTSVPAGTYTVRVRSSLHFTTGTDIDVTVRDGELKSVAFGL